MSKLVILTRQNNVIEFEMWGSPNTGIIIGTNANEIWIVNGQDFYSKVNIDDGTGAKDFSRAIDWLKELAGNGENYLAYHRFDGTPDNFKQTLLESFKNVAEYSLGDNPEDKPEFVSAYKPIANKVKESEVLTEPDFELIKSFFFGDPKLEAYLNLLHECLRYENLPAENESVKQATHFLEKDNDAQNILEKFNTIPDQANLTSLRDELLKDY